MPKIKHFVTFNGIGVPVGEDNRYLDWNGTSMDEAPVPTSPWGPMHFMIGGPRKRVVLDFFELPGGNYVLEVVDEHGVLSVPHLYMVEPKSTVLIEAWRLTEQIVAELGHDETLFTCDAYYFWRALAATVGYGRYAELDDWQLRTEDPVYAPNG